MAQTAYPNSLPASLVAERLRDATSTDPHQFWPDEVSLLTPGIADWRQLISSKQLTDIYLLALAVERHGRFTTFDARIAQSAVPGADDQCLCVI